MTRIAILTPSVTTGDAVSNDVFGMSDVLTRSGHETRIFAEGWSSDVPRVSSVSKISNYLKSPRDLLIYHYSRGWNLGVKLLGELKCRMAIKYHNVTPPEFFVRFNSDFARMCQEGRMQLPAIAGAGCDVYMSASGYNEKELLDNGVPQDRSFVVAPFHHTDRLKSIKHDQRIMNRYQDDSINILMVGRVAPNKNHAALIETFAAYHRDYNQASRLFIVGKSESRLATYNRWLRKIAAHLKVADAVIFTGEVSDSALKSYYMLADAFLMTSEHEGFCVPLIESMSLRVPIVAYATSAIPGTVAGAGLLWSERNPYLLAESVHSIASRESVRNCLQDLGTERYQSNFTNELIGRKFLAAIQPLL